MRILHIVAGSGGFYCENCIRDQVLARKLKELGHDIVLMPLYLPFPEEKNLNVESTPVFYGAINLYLRENYPWYRKMPDWIQKLMNSPVLLKLVARNAGIMRATGLEEMTISMLQGENGGQAQSLERMIEWLKNEHKPEVIHLSNALLIGIAKRLREQFDCPIVCSLQDEDQWVDAMHEAGRKKIWEIISDMAKNVDAFISVSDFYGMKMKERLKLPDAKLHTCHIGIDTGRYKPASPEPGQPTIGYLSRLSESCGVGILINAFIILRQKDKFKNLRLKLAGGFTGDDAKFLEGLKLQLAQKGLSDHCDFVTGYDEESRLAFLRKLTLLSVPSVQPEAFGLFQIEAMASRVPVVQPDTGGFREVVNLSQGGVLYSPNTPEALATAIENLLDNPARLQKLGENGRKGTEKYFSAEKMAERILEIYRKLIV
ncbi:MAG TPA: hypothetical protein DCZ94_03650 [Lentisphaeria bacterium]|nr:MAG: hypothetical protein A2X48_02275 [Lentisphaerae bacterium GWF2_49_21]HBC86028.1 hypothetical protein [Lentisphaeria bacterium]